MRKRFVSFLCMIIFFSIYNLTFTEKSYGASTADLISVKLINNIKNSTVLNFAVNGDYLVEGSTSQIHTGSYTLKIETGRLVLYQGTTQLFTGSSLKMYPLMYKTTEFLSLPGGDYLGQMEFIIENGYIRPINTLPIDDYLKGVVPKETIRSWDIEALKAQAVAARGYAISHIGGVILDSQNSQVYGGYFSDSTYDNSNLAVETTKGQVLTYNGTTITPLYYSSNGGMILSNKNTWGTALFPYYQTKKDPYDLESTTSNKQWSYPLQKVQFSGVDLNQPATWWDQTTEADATFISNLKTKLKSSETYKATFSGYDIKIVSIDNVSYNSTTLFNSDTILMGKVSFSYYKKDATTNAYNMNSNGELMKFTGTYEDESYTIRSLVGTSVMKSPYITRVDNNATEFVIHGGGWGHGVGMSQYGASVMAAKYGKTYQEILDFYYPSTTVEKVIPDPEPVDLLKVDSSLQSPQLPGSSITFNATASGGRELLYQFWVFDGQAWKVIQDYSTRSSSTWTPSAPGNYKISVHVKDKYSNKAYDDFLGSNYSIAGSVKMSSITTSLSSPQVAGTTIQIVANATGGIERLYQFWVYDGKTWKVLRDYTTSNIYNWTPSASGEYKISVHVKDANSSKAYDDYLGINYSIAVPVKMSSITTNPSSPQVAGTTIRIVANATGGIEKLYQFWVYDGETWKVLRDYTTSNIYNWTPSASGEYKISVHVKDANSSKTYDDYLGINYSIEAVPVKMSSVTTSLSSPQKSGTTIQIVANATGGTERLYQFWIYDGKTWRVVRDYTTSNVYNWIPSLPGNYKISVHVKDVNSYKTYDDFYAIEYEIVDTP